MLKHALEDAFRIDRSGSQARASLPCTIAIALSLFGGMWAGRPDLGLVAAGGAMCVGFGAFQALGASRTAPMFWASVGMSVAATIGSLAPHTASGLLFHAAVIGFVYGLLTVLGPGAAWITLQCGIFALVATAYPAGLKDALQRALLVLAGGWLQMIVVLLFRQVHSHFNVTAAYEDAFSGVLSALRTVRENLRWQSPEFRFGLKLAATLGVAAVSAYFLGLSNGYWVPMTALFVLRTELRETFSRGVARVAGTLVGAGLATLLASGLRPGPVAVGALVVLFAWLCYSVVNVNYGVFSVCVTAYIAFLLAFGGLPEKEVVLHRVANTALGGAIALIVAIPELLARGSRRNTAVGAS